MGRSHRVYKGVKFNDKWLEQWAWVRPGSHAAMAKCIWCNKQIALYLYRTGTWALKKHAKEKQHNASKQNFQPSPRTETTKTERDSVTVNFNNAIDEKQVLNSGIEVDDPIQHVSKEIEILQECAVEKTEPDTDNCINATNGKQALNYGIEVDDPKQRVFQEIEILQQCAAEKADLCEATGNIKYVMESNTLRRMAEKKIQKLQRLKHQ